MNCSWAKRCLIRIPVFIIPHAIATLNLPQQIHIILQHMSTQKYFILFLSSSSSYNLTLVCTYYVPHICVHIYVCIAYVILICKYEDRHIIWFNFIRRLLYNFMFMIKKKKLIVS